MGAGTDKGGLAARRAAVALLGAVLTDRRMLADVTADAAGPLAALAPEDRARAQRLALTALRHVERADRLLKPHLRKAPPPPVMNTLRLACAEIFVAGTPPHAAVNAAVSMLRGGRRTAHLAGLANAVLRKVADQAAEWEKLPPQRLPMWLRKPLVDLWGRPVVSAIEAVQAAPPPLDLTVKDPARSTEIAAALGAEVLPTGSLRLAPGAQVSALAGYDAGDWWVQDAAAALPAWLLAPAPGDRVADLCAAPGGKTLQLAAAGAQVTAIDISAARMTRVAENLSRCGLAAETVVADALGWRPAAALDAVLLDAPCSATGTIRRHPDLPFVKDGSETATLAALQARLLDHALEIVKPGGHVVFCTCSLLPEEGEAQVLSARQRHPGLSASLPDLPWIEDAWRSSEGGLRLRPDHWAVRGGIDGFYMAVLRKPS